MVIELVYTVTMSADKYSDLNFAEWLTAGGAAACVLENTARMNAIEHVAGMVS